MVSASPSPVFLLKACAPCCDDCPALFREDGKIAILDQADPSRGWIRLPEADFLAFLADPAVRRTATLPPVHAEIQVGPVSARFLQGEPWGAHVLLVHGGHNVVFLLAEWQASLASPDWVARLQARLAA